MVPLAVPGLKLNIQRLELHGQLGLGFRVISGVISRVTMIIKLDIEPLGGSWAVLTGVISRVPIGSIVVPFWGFYHNTGF